MHTIERVTPTAAQVTYLYYGHRHTVWAMTERTTR